MIRDHDTIAAPATAAGGALAVIRISGEEALRICDRIFRGREPLAAAAGYTVHYGEIVDDGRVLDDVLVTVFRAPRSYTGEDAAEISCHGSQYIVSEILRLLTASGARMAGPGEFTIRANSGNNLHPCLTEKSIPLSQDAYLAAGIVITGLEERLLAFEAEDTDPVVFTVEASYDWTLTVENETWLTVAPKSGKAGSAAQVTITPKANTTDERHESKITITAGDAEFGENTAEEIIELVQAPYMPKDTHAEGYVFFSDDFQWIPDNWVSPYTKYGWPSVSIDGTNGNEFALSTDGMKEAVAAKGYTYTPSVYARYEGHVKLGKTANMGAITIPALTGIDAGKAATLLVQFDAAAYSSAGGTVDNGDDHMDVTIEGPGTIGDLVETSALVEVKNVWEWTRYSLIVYGATNETRITFGSEREVKCRLYLDNITVTRAKDENPEAPAPEALVTPLDKEIVNTSDPSLFDANSMVVAEGGTLTCSVRVNKAWTAETDCD